MREKKGQVRTLDEARAEHDESGAHSSLWRGKKGGLSTMSLRAETIHIIEIDKKNCPTLLLET